MSTEYEYNPFSLNWSGDFNQQVKTVMENVRLTRAEVDQLSSLFFDLQTTFREIWPGCQVMPFGSIVTGLGIRSSDVDCFINILQNHDRNNQAKLVILARNVLRKQQWIFNEPFAITAAKVPIVKFFHRPTGRHCDINFKSPSGVRNSKLIGYLLSMDRRALPLAILIKYWSKVHKLTGTNLIPNYSLSMMIIYYMQHKNILPPVLILQHICNRMLVVDDWNTAFSDEYQHQTDNTESLYELLGGFFQFYSHFKFDQLVISPFLGKALPRQLFLNVNDVPADFDLYKKMVGQGLYPLKIDKPMCIQDVFEHNRNCTVAVFPRLALRVSLHIQLAAKIHVKSNPKSFLREILVKKPQIPKPVKVERPIKPNNNANNVPTPVAALKPTAAPNPAPTDTQPAPQKPVNLKRPGESLSALYFKGRVGKRGKR